MQLGLMGMTILYSSGDYGVAGNDNSCLESDGTQAQGAPIFNPTFPSSCPYVTSVGATQVNPGAKVGHLHLLIITEDLSLGLSACR